MAINPADELRHFSVDSRVAAGGTPDSPGHHTALGSTAGQGTTGIALAGVMSLLAGTDHVVGVEAVSIGIVAI